MIPLFALKAFPLPDRELTLASNCDSCNWYTTVSSLQPRVDDPYAIAKYLAPPRPYSLRRWQCFLWESQASNVCLKFMDCHGLPLLPHTLQSGSIRFIRENFYHVLLLSPGIGIQRCFHLAVALSWHLTPNIPVQLLTSKCKEWPIPRMPMCLKNPQPVPWSDGTCSRILNLYLRSGGFTKGGSASTRFLTFLWDAFFVLQF